jgi:hypothetical protein
VTVRRLILTTAVMAGAAAVLRALTGPWAGLLGTLAEATTVAATAGPERVVVAVAGLLAWTAWAWGALGLLLTAAVTLPGTCGAAARELSRVVLPAGLRTASGLALGVGLVVSAPAAAAAPVTGPVVGAAADAAPERQTGNPGPAVPSPPDWPARPDRPAGTEPAPAEHLVVPGDCLWRIAEDRLPAGGPGHTDADVARAVDRWWSTNAAVIGPDPDLIRPGQVLSPPPGTAPTSDVPPGSAR